MIDPTTLDIKHLRYFVGVVDAGSVTRAAAVLRVAQPALSSRIRRIEDEIGVKLLVRSAQGVHPTEEGKLFYATASRLLRELSDVTAAVRALGREPTGRVIVGCLHSTAEMIAVPLISTVLQQMPKVQLSFVSGQSIDIYHRLASGELDLGIIFKTSNVHSLGSSNLIMEELLLTVSAANDPFGGRDEVSVAELADVGLILPKASVFSVNEMVQRALLERAAAVRVVAEVDSLTALTALVAKGVGASLLPWSAIRGQVSSGAVAVKRLREAQFQRVIELCRPLDRPSTSAIDAVEKIIHAVIREQIVSGEWQHARLAIG